MKILAFFFTLLLFSQEIRARKTDAEFLIEKNLTKTLLCSYDKSERPVAALSLFILFEFLELVDIDAENQVMTSSFHLRQGWYDPRLIWNKTEYNVSNLMIPAESIWIPDTAIMNAVESNGFITTRDATYVSVNSNGLIFLSTPVYRLKTRCKLYNFTRFPFDSQTCPILISSWTFTVDRIYYILKYISTSEAIIAKNSWTYVSYKQRDVNTPPKNALERFIQISLEISLEFSRRPSYIILNCILPTILLNLVTLFSYILPVNIQLKLMLGSIFIYGANWFRMSGEVPMRNGQMPIVVIYFTATFIHAILSLVWFAVLKSLSAKEKLPQSLEKVADCIEAFICRRRSAKVANMNSLNIAILTSESETIDEKKNCVIDRELKVENKLKILNYMLLFISFLFVVILFICISLIISRNPL